MARIEIAPSEFGLLTVESTCARIDSRLREIGYMRLRVYEGGWQTWYASGLERAKVNR